jgi:hypothetical protein
MPGLPHGEDNRAELARWQLGGQRRRSKPHGVGDRLLVAGLWALLGELGLIWPR